MRRSPRIFKRSGDAPHRNAVRSDKPMRHAAPAFEFTRNLLGEIAASSGISDQMLKRRMRNQFRELCRIIEPTTIVEIGAYEASFSKWGRQTFPDARVVAYEANPYVYEKFHDEVQATGVEYIHACAAQTNGPVRLNIPRDFRGNARKRTCQMASTRINLSTEEFETVQVDGVRLDDSLELPENARAVLWIDVEGASESVLRGCARLLKQTRAIHIEVEPEPLWDGQWVDRDVANFLADRGFVPILRDRQRFNYNVVFVRRGLARRPRVARLVASVYAPPPTA